MFARMWGKSRKVAPNDPKNNTHKSKSKFTGKVVPYTVNPLYNNVFNFEKRIKKMESIVNKNGMLLKIKGNINSNVKSDIRVVLAAVKQNGLALQYANKYKNYKRVVMEAVKQNGLAIEFASEDLQGDDDIVKEALKNEDVLYIDGLLENREFVLAAVKYKSYLLRDICIEMNDNHYTKDKEIVMAAVKQDGYIIVDTPFTNDPDVGLIAVQQKGNVLKRLNENLKNNKKIVLAAVKQNGLAIEFASNNLKQDKEIIETAIKQNGLAIYKTELW